jgi:hypothetical protein
MSSKGCGKLGFDDGKPRSQWPRRLPAAVRANDAEALKDVGQSAQESPVLDMLMSHLASQLEKVEAGGPIRPLARRSRASAATTRNLGNDCNTACATRSS